MHCFKREPRNDRKIGILQYSSKDKYMYINDFLPATSVTLYVFEVKD